MNTPPALVEAFLARLGRVLDTARALPRDQVLIRGKPVGYWPDRERPPLTVGGPPFTVGDALARLEHKEPAMAAEMAAELHRMAVALVDPAVLVQVLDVAGREAEIVNSWPLPRFEHEYAGPVGVAWHTLDMLIRASRPTDGALFHDPWPAGAPPDDVARWAQDAFDRGWPAGVRRYIGIGLALLYLAERAELARVRATVAARLAFASVREIGSARDPGPLHFAALKVALAEAGPDDLVSRALADGATRATFAAELVTMARRVAEVAFTGDAPEGETDARNLARDVAEHFAAVLDGIDPRAGTVVRENAGERAEAVLDGRELPGALWILWTDPGAAPEAPPLWFVWLARALWFGPKGWRAALARAARPVAVSRAFLAALDAGGLSARGLDVGTDGRPVVVDFRGEGIAGWRPAGPVATALEAGTLETMARAGLPELARVAAVRFIPWFAHRVQRRPPWLDREPITFTGGAGQEGGALGALAAELGLRADRDGPAALAMLRALAALVLDYPNGAVSSLLSLDYHPGGPGRGRVSRLEITPGRPWFGHDPGLPDGAEHRALVPLPELPGHLPHFRSSPNDRAGCARLYLHILTELAMQSDDIARGLGAHIPVPRLVAWALRLDAMRPPPLLAPAVLADLEAGDVLVKVGPDRWHIAERFPAERALLEAGGRARIGASVGGKLAAEARQEARERLADGKGKGRSGKGRR